MKNVVRTALISGCLFGSLIGANFDVGISGSDRGISGFSLSIGDYYRVPAQEIIVIERSVPDVETSVIYYLARHSHRSPHFILNLRLRGLSWWDITLRLGLDPRTLYFVDSRRHLGPPYGHYGRNHHLNDAEIIDLVNVRFLSSYHGISVDDVIDRRNRGQHYMYIDDDYRMKKYNHMKQKVILRENRYENRERQIHQREIRNENRNRQSVRMENKSENRTNLKNKHENQGNDNQYRRDR
ncbi:hypothetical protein [Sulfuricurvum sp.]|uniref:hypothetical protein n=1 Tax=Sulfuricurvum sp. TaxID=2025608 RepID=UPI003BB21E92